MSTIIYNLQAIKDLAVRPADIQRLARETVNEVLGLIEDDYRSTTATWRHKPRFVKEQARQVGSKIIGRVFTDDVNYSRVNFGTKPRVITARDKPMKFKPGYHPKTSRSLGSGYSARSGPTLFRTSVGHRKPHRITPRRFDLLIAEKHRDSLARVFESRFRSR